ncbi:MAG: hypothetical protein E5X67_19085 [Mesorhizobium sp.]|uniref:hypothetical protein n=1 Tax=Mesorhizobium sp. TaxID=1871066 RepID=UPI000FE61A93|nr:hypothetical protein [Mesorhizobium sp.]RWO30642.1 MAG: hypothetical protein EOS10_19390 [Mesorhizobium sp.]TIP26636.1 MAG: hypothetical protein E5X67_19085 [Mesorhizobium sp.]
MAQSSGYFGCTDKNGSAQGIWYFDGTVATLVGVSKPLNNESSHVVLPSGEDIFDAVGAKLARLIPQSAPFSFERTHLKPGEYYPRMARVIDQHVGVPNPVYHCPGSNTVESQLAIMRGQLVSLTHKLTEICQTVHPSPSNFKVYGHEVRNLLILACTEVEMHWRGVLEANGVSGRFTTLNYVALQSAMRLGEFGILLPYYPWMKEVRPFEGWDSARPTESLPWYRAYNAVKHDREGSFEEGTLSHAIDAVVACAVMLIAQFGQMEAFRWRSEFGYFFQVASKPNWKISESYIHPYDGHSAGLTPVLYPF